MSDLAPFVAAAVRDKTVAELQQENKRLRSKVDHLEAIVDANQAEVASVCIYTDPTSGLSSRQRNRNLESELPRDFHKLRNTCESCAINYSIDILGDEVPCSINTLYLDVTDKTTTCTEATVSSHIGTTIKIPDPVSSLYWVGTYDCQNTFGPCSFSELPTSCEDVLSDVQYTAVRTLQYLTECFRWSLI